MTNEQKIQLADLIISFLSERTSKQDMPILVGILLSRQGIKGFQVADIGHPVFEYRDRYLIYVDSLDGKTKVCIPFYKETLSKVISFTNKESHPN